ncbi:MAG: amidohydrolase [Alistipes sp.]|nr:amidohydrolase [Alistipes sp.]
MGQRVAIVQRDIHWLDAERNLRDIEQMLAGVEADVVVLSEMFSTGFATDPREVADLGAVEQWMVALARKMDSAIVGSVAVKVEEGFRNRMYFAKPTGEVEYYDKRHLFSVGGESKFFSSGRERKVVEWRGVRYMLNICYDLRFPVWCRVQDDYDVLLFSALWPAPRREVWRTLLRARAIENQAYAIGVNRIGEEPGLKYAGDSAVVDYYGRTAVDLEAKEGVAVVELDLEGLASFRKKFNVSADADKFELEICR